MVDERDGGESVAQDDVALQWLLAAYRAMVPVKDVIAYMKQRLAGDGDEHWSSLAMQVREHEYGRGQVMDNRVHGLTTCVCCVCGYVCVCGMQETVLTTTVRDAVCDRFPPHKSYVFRFLKSYMGGRGLQFPITAPTCVLQTKLLTDWLPSGSRSKLCMTRLHDGLGSNVLCLV